jgi:transcriptional regulator with XRE-family HTH domain
MTNQRSMLYTAQIKAARSLLGWKQMDLAEAAGVGLATIQRIEKGDGPASGNYTTVVKIQAALEKAGIEFTDGDGGGIGVRLKRPPTKAR